MRIEHVLVTPELARDWLAASTTRNRNLSKIRVERFALAIQRGQWRLTHQPIALDASGNILDGQHRLSAVVEAGAGAPFMIAYDADPDTFAVIDTGAARTAANALQIAGHPNAHALASATRLVLIYELCTGSTASGAVTASSLITTQDVLDVLDTARGELLAQMVPMAAGIQKRARMRAGARTWLAAWLTLLHEAPGHDEAKRRFCDGLADGAMLAPDSPVLVLRGYLGNAVQHSVTDRVGVMAVTTKAFSDYVTGKPRRLLAFRYDELVPRIPTP